MFRLNLIIDTILFVLFFVQVFFLFNHYLTRKESLSSQPTDRRTLWLKIVEKAEQKINKFKC